MQHVPRHLGASARKDLTAVGEKDELSPPHIGRNVTRPVMRREIIIRGANAQSRHRDVA
jgi:hypothetical protein